MNLFIFDYALLYYDGACISETCERIFSEFLPSSEYAMLDDTDFELYSDNFTAECFCEIWIPVEKKTNL